MISYDTVVLYILTSITVLGIAVFTQLIYSLRMNVKSILLYTLIVGIISCVLIKVIDDKGMILRTAVSFLTMLVFLKVIFKISLAQSFIAIGLFVVLQAFGNVLTTIIFSALGIDYIAAKNDTRQLVLAHSIMNVVNIITFVLIKSYKLFSTFTKVARTRAYITSIIYIGFTIVIIAVNFSFYYNIHSVYTDSTGIIINSVLMLSYFLFCVINTTTFFKLESQKQELEYQIFYNKTLDSLMSDLRRFKHNYNNMLSVMSGYLNTNSFEDMKHYMGELMQDNQASNNTHSVILMNVKNAAILGLTLSKLEHANKHGISIMIKVEGEIKEVNMRISDLCETLGILLDNAIEASAESSAKIIKLSMENRNNIVSFRIENSIGTQPNIGEIFIKGYSTRGDNRGLGLWIVRNMVDKYSNVLLNTCCEKDMFSQELVIT